MSKTVYGEYTIANAIGAVVGYATQDDFGVQETGNVESKEIGGETVQEIISNHGMTASGTVALSDAQKAERIKVGALVRITLPDGTTRPFVVDSWDKSIDTDTGGAVASVSAHSYDSMVEQYEIGPRDPDTGEPLSGKVKCIVSTRFFDGYVDADAIQGVTFGLFAISDMPTVTGTVGNLPSLRVDSLVDMSKAVATAKAEGTQFVFVVTPGQENMVVAANFNGKVIVNASTNPPGYHTIETTEGVVVTASMTSIPLADASDSSSASA